MFVSVEKDVSKDLQAKGNTVFLRSETHDLYQVKGDIMKDLSNVSKTKYQIRPNATFIKGTVKEVK